jgi:ligand-binding sensor domain-containing protein
MNTNLLVYFSIFCILASKVLSANPECITYTFGDDIITMIDDRDYLWLGTDGGLVKFNKLTEEKVIYNKANTNNGLMDNHIRALAFDSKKNLWIGTEYGGISKFDGNNWLNFNPENSPLPYEYISCIAIDKNDNIFIGNGNYLSIFDESNWSSYEIGSPYLTFFGFHNIVFDTDNRGWIATKESGPSRIFVYENNQITSIENDTTYSINSLIIDKNNSMWCGSSEMGLLKFDGTHFEKYDTSNSNIPSNNIYVSNIDNDNNLWCTTDSIIWRYDKEVWYSFEPDISLPNYFIAPNPRTIVNDSYGSLWIATWGAGLLKYSENKWNRFKTSNSGLINNFINLIATDEDGKVWITFYQPRDSVLYFDGVNWLFYKKEDYNFWNSNFKLVCNNDSVQIWQGKGILVEFVQTDYNWVGVYNIKNHRHGNDIKLDMNDNIWQVSFKKGLWKYDQHNWTFYNYQNTPIDFQITSKIAFDNAGNLYAISDRGIIKYDGENWILYPPNFFLSDTLKHGLSAFEIDKLGNIWLGTVNKGVSDTDFGEGVIKFDGIDITRFNYTNSPIPNSKILNLHFDSQDNLWIGTESAGLIKFDCKDTWKIYNSENSGIFSRFDIAPLEIDIYDNIWFGNWWGGLGVFHEGGVITEVRINDNGLKNPSQNFSILQNYPNPFNPYTSIKFQISRPSFVTIKVFDILGKEVATLVNEDKKPGIYKINFDGSSLTSGLYFYTINAKNFHQTNKFILLH